MLRFLLLSLFILQLAGCDSEIEDGTGGGGSSHSTTVAASSTTDGASSSSTSASTSASTTGGGPEACLEACQDCAFEHAWSKGVQMTDYGGASSVAPGPDGGTIVAGSIQAAVDFGGGPLQPGGLVARFDESGSFVWGHTYPNASVATITTQLPGRVLMAGPLAEPTDFGGGPIAGTAFIAELDADGNHMWSHAFGGDAFVIFNNAVIHPDGDVVFELTFNGTIDLGAGPIDSTMFSDNPLLAKVSTTGELRWSVFADTIGLGDAMDVGADGTIVWAIDAGSEFDEPFDVLGTMVTGPGTHLVAVNAAGDPLWQRTLTTDYSLLASDLAIGPEGSVVLTGVVDGLADFGMGASEQNGSFLAKYDPSGEPLWSFAFTDPDDPKAQGNWGYRVEVDGCDEIVLVAQVRNADFGGGPIGVTPPTVFQDGELGVVRLGPNGEHRASASYGLRYGFPVGEPAITSDGRIVIVGGAGEMDGVIDFGGGPVHTDEPHTFFLAELTP